jgi:hypothetical protein
MNICLQDWIGLRGCSTIEPESGVYINQYPGMSTELLDKVASSDQITFAQVWQDVQQTAYLQLKTGIQKALKDFAGARLDQVLFQTSKLFVQQWQQINPVPAEAIYKGVFTSIAGSKYAALRVKKAYIYNSGNVAVDNVVIKFFQCQDGTVLYQKTVTVQPGANFITINQTFNLVFDKINIAMLVDCTNLPTLTGQFIDNGSWNWQGMDAQCASRYYSWLNTSGFNIFPVTAPLNYGLGQDWNNDWSQSAIYWDAELLCSLDAFICGQREFLVEAWGNLLSASILRFKLGSQRVNYFTQSNRELTERAYVSFEDGYKEALNNWAEQLNLANEGLCFDCEDQAMISTSGRRP